MTTQSKPAVVDVKESEDKPLARGESSGARGEEEVDINTGGFFYRYCGGNPVTAVITPGLSLAALLVIILGLAAYVKPLHAWGYRFLKEAERLC